MVAEIKLRILMRINQLTFYTARILYLCLNMPRDVNDLALS
jgi:hypothetical protein